MRSCPWILVAAGLLTLGAAPAAADTLLTASFTGMTAGQPVGLGGPTLGEPDGLQNCVATIRDAPFPTTCLELDDETDFGTGGAHFAFLGDPEVTSGAVEIAVKLWFGAMDNYYLYVREPHFAASNFTSVDFMADGSVNVSDATGSPVSAGTYETGRAIELIVMEDLDAGTYDIWWDGTLVIDNRAHGIAGVGVGGLYIGIGHDLDTDGLLYVDDLLVTTGPFTADDSPTWGGLKALWR